MLQCPRTTAAICTASTAQTEAARRQAEPPARRGAAPRTHRRRVFAARTAPTTLRASAHGPEVDLASYFVNWRVLRLVEITEGSRKRVACNDDLQHTTGGTAMRKKTTQRIDSRKHHDRSVLSGKVLAYMTYFTNWRVLKLVKITENKTTSRNELLTTMTCNMQPAALC